MAIFLTFPIAVEVQISVYIWQYRLGFPSLASPTLYLGVLQWNLSIMVTVLAGHLLYNSHFLWAQGWPL